MQIKKLQVKRRASEQIIRRKDPDPFNGTRFLKYMKF